MQFYGVPSSSLQAPTDTAKIPVEAVSPEVCQKREEEALDKEWQRKKRRLASAHKLLHCCA